MESNMKENESQEESGKTVSTPNVAAVENNTPGSLESPKDIRQWFSQLSADDRAAALGFVDGTMLSVFSRLAPWSSSFPTTTGTNGGYLTTDERPNTDLIDWTMKVRLCDIEAAYNEVSDESKTAQNEDVLSQSSPRNQQPVDSPVDCPSEEDEGGENTEDDFDNKTEVNDEQPGLDVDSDAFRIRGKGVDSINETTTPISDETTVEALDGDGVETVSVDIDSSIKPTPAAEVSKSSHYAKVLDLMDSIRAVYPSLFKMVTSDAIVGIYPFITMHSTYLATANGEELISSLDEIMSTGETEHPLFLSPISSPSWMDAVHAVSIHPSVSTTESIPLYILLLLRFQISVSESFRKATADQKTLPVGQGDDSPLSIGTQGPMNSDIATPSIEQSGAAVDEKLTEEVSTSEETPEPNATNDKTLDSFQIIPMNPADNAAALLYKKFYPTLLSRLSSSKNDPSKLCDTMSPLRSCLQEIFPEETSLVDALVMPLLHVLRQTTRKDATFDDAMMMIDQAVRETIGRVEKERPAVDDNNDITDPVPEFSTIDSSQSGENDFEPKVSSAGLHASELAADEAADDSSSVTLPGSPGRKNAKKKKKKKKRKGSNGTQPAQQLVDSDIQTGAKPAGRADGVNDEIQEDESNGNSTRLDPNTVAAVSSFDSDKSHESRGILSKSSSQEDRGDERVGIAGDASMDDLHVLRIDDVAVAQPDAVKSKTTIGEEKKASESMESADKNNDDHTTWETVEVRSRGNRKKATDRGNHGRFGSHLSSGGHQGSGSKKSKVPRTKASRTRITHRKMAREILSSVLDAVDEEVRKRRHSQPWRDGPRVVGNKWAMAMNKNKIGGIAGRTTNASEFQKTNKKKEATTMRDILIGRQGNSNAKGMSGNSSQVSQRMYSDRARQRPEFRADGKHASSRQPFENCKKSRDKPERMQPVTSSKTNTAPAADQNTAPTIPETLSAMSTNLLPRDSGMARSDSSSGGSVGVSKPQRSSLHASKEVSPSPPLPTLLSPGNANSASSSVASSLDAPHAGHHGNHHSSYPGSENGVGYHLLDVCERLSRDIDIFMKRREHALDVRRKERGQVLVALHDTLSKIWPGMCTVEMYGSCATKLDLPSSDLDIVACGLDRPVETTANIASNSKKSNIQPDAGEKAWEMKSGRQSPNSANNSQEVQQHTTKQRTSQQHAPMPIMYGQMSPNGERVVRLAMELEQQPWAVHVKAIPTATVPVIKILADPAKLPGAALSGNGEWRVQPPLAAQSGPVGSQNQNTGSQIDDSVTTPASIPNFQGSPPPWRGADVVNGLLKVDITFEGPEHGGIGSTEFSSRVIQDFCEETGLSLEGTPAVQVIMVLKELLAQRRLNEPFSGGLSSYTLLLLVISIVRERKIIREELERLERQRKLVAAGGGNSVLHSNPSEAGIPALAGTPAVSSAQKMISKTPSSRSKKVKGANVQTEDIRHKGVKEAWKSESRGNKLVHAQPPSEKSGKSAAGSLQKVGVSSSWATIARKSSPAPVSLKASQDSIQCASSEKKGQQSKLPAKGGTFADAVAKGTRGGAASAGALTQASRDVGGDKGRAHSKKNEAKVSAGGSSSVKAKLKTRQETAAKSSSPVPASPKPSAQGKASSLTQHRQHATLNAYEPGSLFPQSFHDVIEVLCSGETTPGKLLMHFLLFYGQHFDSQSTAIDYSGTHERDMNANNGYSLNSPYMQRRTAGSFDPMTGMLTVDPIVVYDPLEGAELNNVARSCFAWSNIRWVFAQSYMTLSSAVEMRADQTSGQSGGKRGKQPSSNQANGASTDNKVVAAATWNGPYSHDEAGSVVVDPSSSLLELLVSF